MSADIVIAGGGPNGLMLACELGSAGIRPLVIERLPRRSPQPKANAVVGEVVHLLHRRGLGTGRPTPARAFMFGALPLDLADLAGNPLTGMQIKQARLEEQLERRAVESGARIRRGHELTRLEQDADGVMLNITGPEGPYRLCTRYLVGCDGGHSTVRKLSGIDFPGVSQSDIVSRAAEVTVPGARLRPERAELLVPGIGTFGLYAWHRTERGAYAMLPTRPGVLTVSSVEWGGGTSGEEVPMTIAELGASLARVAGVDLPLAAPVGDGPYLMRRLNGRNTRVADRYRAGRVFLAGDAAHVHSAMGAPGLNLGLQDAANLAWKLAAAVRGWAAPDLLDTYQAERRPAALRVAMHSRAQLALTAPGCEVTALREVFGELLAEEGNRRRIAALLAGTDLPYPTTAPPHPLVGRFLADLPARLDEPVSRARPLLLDPTGSLRVRHSRVEVVHVNVPEAVLVRPDGFVAWAGAPDRTLDEALRTWFGDSLVETGSVADRRAV